VFYEGGGVGRRVSDFSKLSPVTVHQKTATGPILQAASIGMLGEFFNSARVRVRVRVRG
jgi:hypothetical protein